ncbi:MAG: phage portal protein [Phascolarctobacterium sp.]|nr:phage portal protein [Candidatus Phascolarctobacterium caballi]
MFEKIKALLRGPVTKHYQHPIAFGRGSTIRVDAHGDLTYATCIEIISKYMAQIKWGVYSKDNVEAKRAVSRCNRMLNFQPCDGINAYDFWRNMEQQRLAKGNAFAYIRGNKLIPLQPERMTIFWDNAGLFAEKRIIYQYSDEVSQQTLTFLPEEILHFKAYSANGIVGRSAFDVMVETLKANAEVEGAMRGAVKSGVSGTIVVEFTADLGEQKKKALQEKVMERLKDSESKFLLLPPGMKAEVLGNDIRAYHETLKNANIEAITAFFGIPLAMVNKGTGAGTATFSTNQLTQFYNTTVQPIICHYAAEMNVKLLTTGEQLAGCYFDSSNDAFEFLDAHAKASVLTSYVGGGVLTPNEARTSLKYPRSNDPQADKLNFRGGSGAIGDGAGTGGEGGRPNGS